jgi:alginate O-acetyltransferase complex protein AlgI
VTDLGELGIYFERLLPFLPGEPINIMDGDWIQHGTKYGALLLVGIVFCTELPRRIYERYKHTVWMSVLLLAIFWGSVYYLYLGLNDPFLYFRF